MEQIFKIRFITISNLTSKLRPQTVLVGVPEPPSGDPPPPLGKDFAMTTETTVSGVNRTETQRSLKRPMEAEDVYFLDASKEGNVSRFINVRASTNSRRQCGGGDFCLTFDPASAPHSTAAGRTCSSRTSSPTVTTPASPWSPSSPAREQEDVVVAVAVVVGVGFNKRLSLSQGREGRL